VPPEVPMMAHDLSHCILGEFLLQECIGNGPSGIVYRGEQLLLGRGVAVKVLHQRYDDLALQRCMREAQIEHPFVAHVYAVGIEQDGPAWIASELVHGISVDRWLQARGPMPLELFVPLFQSLAEVVQAAHDRGIVHGNLKPSNVMVVEGRGQLLPKLLDLGIHQLTSNDVPMGPAADLYALGVFAYEALTGRVPFLAETLNEHGQRNGDAPVPPLDGDFAPDLNRLFQRALARSPDDRHRNAMELASELGAALRVSPREQIRTAAQQWDDRGRPRGLLLGSDALAKFAKGDALPRVSSASLRARFSRRARGTPGDADGSGARSWRWPQQACWAGWVGSCISGRCKHARTRG
jgi:serine/threonine protein kinase